MGNNKKRLSTIERWRQNPGFRAGVDHEYKELVLSELVLAIMAKDSKSVRKLVAEVKGAKCQNSLVMK